MNLYINVGNNITGFRAGLKQQLVGSGSTVKFRVVGGGFSYLVASLVVLAVLMWLLIVPSTQSLPEMPVPPPAKGGLDAYKAIMDQQLGGNTLYTLRLIYCRRLTWIKLGRRCRRFACMSASIQSSPIRWWYQYMFCQQVRPHSRRIAGRHCNGCPTLASRGGSTSRHPKRHKSGTWFLTRASSSWEPWRLSDHYIVTQHYQNISCPHTCEGWDLNDSLDNTEAHFSSLAWPQMYC